MTMTRTSARIAILVLSLILPALAHPAPAGAFSSGSNGSASDNPDMIKGNAAVMERRFEDALASFKRVLDSDPENANAWSQSGFSYRKLGQFEKSLQAYQHALEIEPFHLSANEYLGELYLQTDQVEKAEEMALILNRACPRGCEELTALRTAIETYRKSGGKIKWTK